MKTCLVGCGGIAAVHGSVLTSGIDTEFVAAADIKPEKAQTYAENFHTKPYPSLESMLEAEKPMSCISARRTICTFRWRFIPWNEISMSLWKNRLRSLLTSSKN